MILAVKSGWETSSEDSAADNGYHKAPSSVFDSPNRKWCKSRIKASFSVCTTTLIKSEFTTTNNATLLPRQYLDLHDLNKFSISSVNSNRTVNLPSIAWNPWMDVKKRDDIKALDITFPFGRMPSRFTKYIRHHYYAGTTLVKMRSQFEEGDDRIMSLFSPFHSDWKSCKMFQSLL